jgi:hypothetical protein
MPVTFVIRITLAVKQEVAEVGRGNDPSVCGRTDGEIFGPAAEFQWWRRTCFQSPVGGDARAKLSS